MFYINFEDFSNPRRFESMRNAFGLTRLRCAGLSRTPQINFPKCPLKDSQNTRRGLAGNGGRQRGRGFCCWVPFIAHRDPPNNNRVPAYQKRGASFYCVQNLPSAGRGCKFVEIKIEEAPQDIRARS